MSELGQISTHDENPSRAVVEDHLGTQANFAAWAEELCQENRRQLFALRWNGKHIKVNESYVSSCCFMCSSILQFLYIQKGG